MMNKQLYRIIAWNTMQLRQSKGLRQEDLARLTGLSRHQVSRIECGLGNITLDNLMKVSDFFEVPVSRLCEEDKRNRDLELKLRDTHQEKEDLKFSKVFYESPRLKIMELSSTRIRRMKIQKNQVYDLLALIC